MSPFFELSTTALTFVIVIGSLTALLMGLVGIVQNDIKRVVAYSTLSQLGYMTVALGASAYGAAIFHLMTHAFFKALLFLAAGSVIIGMHHEQDIRKMGGLKKYMPITYWTSLIGTLALIGFPGFSGFFSKDAIIEAVHYSEIPGAGFAYICVLLGVFITSFYSFRMFFLVFHGKERFDDHTREHLHESPKVVTWPLILLAIPSVILGALTIGGMLFGGFFGDAIQVDPARDVLAKIGKDYHGVVAFVLHGFKVPAVYLALAGAVSAWFIYLHKPSIADWFADKFSFVHRILDNKYGFDDFNQKVFAGGSLLLANKLWTVGDVKLIDGIMVNGTANKVGLLSTVVRKLGSGYLYNYAFAMIVGLLAMLSIFIFTT